MTCSPAYSTIFSRLSTSPASVLVMIRAVITLFDECSPGRRKLAVKVVDIFGNDIMTIVEVAI